MRPLEHAGGLRLLWGPDFGLLASISGEGPPNEGEMMACKRFCLPRHPFRGRLIGLGSWHANTVSANQDLPVGRRYFYLLCYSYK